MVSIFTPVSADTLPIVSSSAREAVISRIHEVLDPVVATGCRLKTMMIKDQNRAIESARGSAWLAAGGLLGALAASSCCILPLVLFGLGVSGAWIGNFTRLAPYQPCFIAATLVFLGAGYWLVYRSSKLACADGEACARRLAKPAGQGQPHSRNDPCYSRARLRLRCTTSSQLVCEGAMYKLLASAAVALLVSSDAFAAERTVTLAV